MGFRTLDICQAAEVHIKMGQIEISSSSGTVSVPVEDLFQITAHGANIRLSTMDLSILARNNVSLLTFDEKYLPTAVMLPFEGNARQAKIMHAQVAFSKEQYEQLWIRIIKYKINNQARVLNILGELGSDIVAKYGASISVENVDYNESLAAKEYFKYYRDGLNRRIDDPINSRLNYGYAVVRSAIIRTLVTAGFHPAFGIHHNNQLNLYNLADDLIEPYRQIVDLLASQNLGELNVLLSKAERKNMASVLHIACSLDGIKMNVMSAIEMTVDSLKRILVKGLKEELLLPCVLPVESIGGVTE